MTAIFIILGIVAYLGIGGFLAGIFNDVGIDDFQWYIAWPFMVIYVLVCLITQPFQNLGEHINEKLRGIRKR